MAKTIPIIIALLLAGLFAISIITSGIMLGEQNNAAVNIKDEPTISEFYNSINNSLADNSVSVTKSYDSLSNSTITTTGSIPFVITLGGIWKLVTKTPGTIWNLIANLVFTQLFGSAAGVIVLITISSIVLLILIGSVIYWIATGQGDK